MSAIPQSQPTPAAVLSKALRNAGARIGLTQQEVAQVIGRARSRLRDDLEPSSKSGELALLLIRVARSLAVMVGNDEQVMAHWMRTRNRHLNGVPAELIRSVEGLARVTRYLDAMRGRV